MYLLTHLGMYTGGSPRKVRSELSPHSERPPTTMASPEGSSMARAPASFMGRGAAFCLRETCNGGSFSRNSGTGHFRVSCFGVPTSGRHSVLEFLLDNGMEPLHSTFHPGFCHVFKDGSKSSTLSTGGPHME